MKEKLNCKIKYDIIIVIISLGDSFVKKIHLIIIIITGMTIIFSAYSLAAFNQVYKINFDWYSQYNNRFLSEMRNDLNDEWKLSEYPQTLKFDIITDKNGIANLNLGSGNTPTSELTKVDFNKYVLIQANLGNVNSLEYRMKFSDIAQREAVIELKVTLNSPTEKKEKKVASSNQYFLKDIIRIDRTSFPVKGKLHFIFKNQNGKQLYECYSYIK